jgi:hypothetical protein
MGQSSTNGNDTVQPHNESRTETSGAQTLTGSIERAIGKWPEWFQDLVNGEDIARWQQKAINVLAPIALNGYQTDIVSVGGIFTEEDVVDMVVPAFFSKEEPNTAVGPGGKAKLKGMADGLVFFVGNQLGIVYELGSMYLLYRSKPGEVKDAYKVKFGFSLASMTSAGPGYELILSDGPMVFRLAVEFKRGTYKESEFDNLLGRLTS